MGPAEADAAVRRSKPSRSKGAETTGHLWAAVVVAMMPTDAMGNHQQGQQVKVGCAPPTALPDLHLSLSRPVDLAQRGVFPKTVRRVESGFSGPGLRCR